MNSRRKATNDRLAQGPGTRRRPTRPGQSCGTPSRFECGDRLLVLVECEHNALSKPTPFWDIAIIVPTETGFDDANGESWDAWDWSDVSWWVKLDKTNLPELK